MWGKATLEIPATGFCGPIKTYGLSDDLAMVMGRMAAWTLPDEHEHVVVELSDDTTKIISIDTLTHEVVIGTLTTEARVRSHEAWLRYRT